MGALKYWIWLATLGKQPGMFTLELLEHFGSPEATYAAKEEEYSRIPRLPAAIKNSLCNKSLQNAEQILQDCLRQNIQILTIQDIAYPERLRHIMDPPCVIYVKGSLPSLDDDTVIGMVGCREATPYGAIAYRRF